MPSNQRKILLLPGDGIGPEVVRETKKVIAWCNKKKSVDFNGRKKEVIEILTEFNSKNNHKMIPIPICKIPEYLKTK